MKLSGTRVRLLSEKRARTTNHPSHLGGPEALVAIGDQIECLGAKWQPALRVPGLLAVIVCCALRVNDGDPQRAEPARRDRNVRLPALGRNGDGSASEQRRQPLASAGHHIQHSLSCPRLRRSPRSPNPAAPTPTGPPTSRSPILERSWPRPRPATPRNRPCTQVSAVWKGLP